MTMPEERTVTLNVRLPLAMADEEKRLGAHLERQA